VYLIFVKPSVENDDVKEKFEVKSQKRTKVISKEAKLPRMYYIYNLSQRGLQVTIRILQNTFNNELLGFCVFCGPHFRGNCAESLGAVLALFKHAFFALFAPFFRNPPPFPQIPKHFSLFPRIFFERVFWT
jgi:hypothetical protein